MLFKKPENKNEWGDQGDWGTLEKPLNKIEAKVAFKVIWGPGEAQKNREAISAIVAIGVPRYQNDRGLLRGARNQKETNCMIEAIGTQNGMLGMVLRNSQLFVRLIKKLSFFFEFRSGNSALISFNVLGAFLSQAPWLNWTGLPTTRQPKGASVLSFCTLEMKVN